MLLLFSEFGDFTMTCSGFDPPQSLEAACSLAGAYLCRRRAEALRAAAVPLECERRALLFSALENN